VDPERGTAVAADEAAEVDHCILEIIGGGFGHTAGLESGPVNAQKRAEMGNRLLLPVL
jgi:hypothetical protein